MVKAKTKHNKIIIVINDDFYIARDSMSYNLYRKGLNNKGKIKIDLIGYYHDVSKALERACILINDGKLNGTTTAEEYLKSLRETIDELKETIKKGINR